jgi:hypothetical protein
MTVQLESSQFILAIAALITAFIMSVMLLIIMLIRNSQKAMHYNFELQRAAISADREFYERQLEKTAMQMTASEDRWRDANHLVISEKNTTGLQNSKPDFDAFISRFGLSRADIDVDRRMVMVLTPFSDSDRSTFELIRDTCVRVGLNAVRGDEQFTSTDILTHVIQLILKARLIIANISTRNANVFYELGIAHAMNKPTILISKSLNDTPFDIMTNRIIVYRSDKELRSQLTESLARVMAEIGAPLPSISPEIGKEKD